MSRSNTIKVLRDISRKLSDVNLFSDSDFLLTDNYSSRDLSRVETYIINRLNIHV